MEKQMCNYSRHRWFVTLSQQIRLTKWKTERTARISSTSLLAVNVINYVEIYIYIRRHRVIFRLVHENCVYISLFWTYFFDECSLPLCLSLASPRKIHSRGLSRHFRGTLYSSRPPDICITPPSATKCPDYGGLRKSPERIKLAHRFFCWTFRCTPPHPRRPRGRKSPVLRPTCVSCTPTRET